MTKNWIIIILILLLLITGYFTLNPKIKIIQKDSIIYKTDTVEVFKVDTVYKSLEPKVIIKEVPKIVYKTVNDSIRYYMDTTVTEEVRIVVMDSILGKILDRKLVYTLFVPKEIIKTQIKTVTNTKIQAPDRQRYILLGLESYSEGRRHYSIDYLENRGKIVFGVGLTTMPGIEFKIGYKL